MDKAQFRKKQKEIRKSLDIKQISSMIIKRLFDSAEFIEAKRVFTYISLPEEVDTREILKNTDKKVFVPKLAGEDIKMVEYSAENLLKNKFGIYEPLSEVKFFPAEKDVIIIPALAADKNFNRLGYGCGYYDRFLAKNKGTKIILIPEKLFVNEIPTEQHDVSADIIVTENNVFRNLYH